MEKAVDHFFLNEKNVKKTYPSIMVNLIDTCIQYPYPICFLPNMFSCKENDKNY